MEFLWVEQNWLFTASLAAMLGIGVIELFAVLLGASLSAYVDGFVPEPGDLGGLAWLHIGRVPFLVVLVLLLALFALGGFLIQGVADIFIGHRLPTVLAAPAAFLLALPGTRTLAGAIGRMLPRDESYAIRSASLVGRSAVVVAGEARKGRAAEAKFRDEFDQTHYVLVEPEADSVLVAGERVLLVRQIGEGRFVAVSNPVTD